MATPAPFSYANVTERKQEDKALRLVTLEGNVVLKIIKHCQESQPSLVTGQLLGLDIGSSLEVTDCYPFPASSYTQALLHPVRHWRRQCQMLKVSSLTACTAELQSSR